MTDGMDRDELIGLLEKLRSAEDAEVLTAAREVDARMSAANVTWADLLKPAAIESEDEPAEVEDAAEAGAAPEGPPPDDAEVTQLIDALLASKELSDALRDELEDYKKDIAEGEFEAMDREYVRSLHRRLTQRA